MAKLIKFNRRMKNRGRPTASKVLKEVIRREIALKAEVKQIDCVLSGSFSTTLALATGGTTIMSDIAEGTSEIQRVGDQILVKSLNFRGSVEANNGFDQEQYCYVAIVLYKTSDGRSPTTSEIWTTATNIGVSLRHPDFMQEYSVLKILKVKLQPNFGPSASDAPCSNLIWNHRFKGQGMKVQYDGNTGAAADVITNSIFVYIQCYPAPNSSPASLIGGVLRINYTD